MLVESPARSHYLTVVRGEANAYLRLTRASTC